MLLFLLFLVMMLMMLSSVRKFALTSHTKVGKFVGKCKGGKFALLLNFVLVLNKSAKKVSSTEVSGEGVLTWSLFASREEF